MEKANEKNEEINLKISSKEAEQSKTM